MVTMLNIVSKRWLLCWILFQNYGYYVGYCFETLATVLDIVSKLWLLCWPFFKTLVNVYDTGFFKTLVTLLVIVSKHWLLCWILFTNVGYNVGYCFRILVTMLANVHNVFVFLKYGYAFCKRIG